MNIFLALIFIPIILGLIILFEGAICLFIYMVWSMASDSYRHAQQGRQQANHQVIASLQAHSVTIEAQENGEYCVVE